MRGRLGDVADIWNELVWFVIRVIDPEADDPFRVDADDRAVEFPYRIGRGVDRLRVPADFETADAPGLPGGDVVNHECDPTVAGNIVELPASRIV